LLYEHSLDVYDSSIFIAKILKVAG
jgi:hypothetical protein